MRPKNPTLQPIAYLPYDRIRSPKPPQDICRKKKKADDKGLKKGKECRRYNEIDRSSVRFTFSFLVINNTALLFREK